MLNVAGDHLYGKKLFTWLSLVMSLMVSFVLSFFPRHFLGVIWDITESVSEGFPTYSWFQQVKLQTKLLLFDGCTTSILKVGDKWL